MHNGHHPYAVGQRYRFAGEYVHRQYGEWVVTRIEGSMLYGKSAKMGGETYMVELSDAPNKGDYAVIPMEEAVDEVASFFV